MNTLEGKIVLITGASSGIGAGTAKHFASLKCRLSLVGRNQEALNNVAEECREKGAIEVLVLVKDLMAADACRDVVSSTVAHFECNFLLKYCCSGSGQGLQFNYLNLFRGLWDPWGWVRIWGQNHFEGAFEF